MFKQIDSYIEQNREELIELTSKLTSFNTSTPPGDEYGKFVEYASTWLENAGLKVTVFSVPDEQLPDLLPPECRGARLGLFAEINGSGQGPTLCFQGHYDTVPPCDGWSYDPFVPLLRGDRLYGLGTTDMKGGLASMMMACKAIIKSGIDLEGKIVFAATPDEEYSSKVNLKYFLERNVISAGYAVVGEFSGVSNLYVGMKGGTWGDIIVRGISAHGSVPHKGVNAFEKIAKVTCRIESDLKVQLAQQKTKFGVLAGELPHTTLMLGGTLSSTGTARSMVPTNVKVSFDLRSIPDVDQAKNEEMLLEYLSQLQQEDPELKIEAKIVSKFPGYVVDTALPFCHIAVEAINEVIGKKPSLSICSAAMETAFFHEYGSQVLAYGPGIPGLAHAADEYVLVSEMQQSAKVYARIAANLLSKKSQ